MTSAYVCPGFIHVAFEGIDGSGKGLQVQLLVDELQRQGRSVVRTAEPSSGTELGKIIRDQFYAQELDELEMNVLFAAERIIHRRLWMPQAAAMASATDGGDERAIVVSDRSVWSAYAYHGIDNDMHAFLSPESTWPDHAIVLDVDPVMALERVNDGHRRRGHDRWENLPRLQQARQNYITLSNLWPSRVHVVDGEGSVYEVAARVLAEVTSWRV